ncbi:MAG TPA: TQO small subunit DoxD [Solirubrobacteraceae bacterium]|jgi:thiosulfate dehydrogenase [quinone] large subunit|nr:TQO small subunit DoxD [Solirubrobacteraceae bacterium]
MELQTTTERPPNNRRPSAAETEARRLGWALFPVRLFLGVTVVYGGIQKLSDPGYLHPGAPTYIGTQLHGFANGTPGGLLLRALAIPHPQLAGVGVALVEIIVGLLVTAGLLTRAAAAVGLVLNLLLFLTNSWHTSPYFLGSDIVFVFAWLPFVLVGASRQPNLAPALHRLAAAMTSPRRPAAERHPPGATGAASATGLEPELTRRAAIGAALGLAGTATAVIAGLSILSRGAYRAPRAFALATRHRGAPAPAPTTPGRATPGTATTPGAGQPPAGIAAPTTSAQSLPAGAVKLGPASRLPAGQGATYPDPTTGNPDIVIRQANGTLVAHSAVCTHAGCTVGYQGGQIMCPCHGAVYDAQTGAVISGPAPAPLAPRRVLERAGEIYALPS